MKANLGLTATLASILAVLGFPPTSAGEPAPNGSGAARMTVLDSASYWRVHLGWRTPMNRSADGKLSVPTAYNGKKPLKDWCLPPPPDDWVKPGFDDSGWSRGQLPAGVDPVKNVSLVSPGNPEDVNTICVRGKFLVTDPAGVKELKVSVTFSGGAVVYLNGRELKRAHLPEGTLSAETLAEDYPSEAKTNPALRARNLAEVSVPADALRKGLNVLAVRVQRAPLGNPYAKLFTVTLSAAPGSALEPNLDRPKGVQVWAAPPLESVYPWDYGDPAEAPPALRIAGARGGIHSARFAVSSGEPIKGLKVSMSEPAHSARSGVSLPAGACLVRYSLTTDAAGAALRPYQFDILSPNAPGEVPAKPVPDWRSKEKDPALAAACSYPSRYVRMAEWLNDGWLVQRAIPPGVSLPPPRTPGAAAVQPVWITVQIPAEAEPGEYRGEVTVAAQGLSAMKLPLTVAVSGWRMPAPKDFVTHNNLYVSADTPALHYKVPLWSDRHWELMGRSLEMSAPVGNKLCVVPLTAGGYNLGNAESMVRWIKQADGSYQHDFTIMDRYLDLCAAKLGKPGVVKLYVWGRYGNGGKNRDAYKITVLDKATGKTEAVPQPVYGTPESLALWKPVMDEVRKRLEKRGWMDVAALAVGPDEGVEPAAVTMFRKIWPDGKWMSSAHPLVSQYNGAEKEKVPVPYCEWVWGAGWLYDPDGEKHSCFFQYGSDEDWAKWRGRAYPRPWKRGSARLEWVFPRYGVSCIHKIDDSFPLSSWRWISETVLQGGQNGIGNCGFDLWPIAGRGPLCGNSHMGPAASFRTLVSPGPDGPAATERYEAFREGVQVCEAIIFLTKALDAKTLGPELTDKVERCLDDRARHCVRSRPGQEYSWWALNTGWQEREERLFAVCAEVAAKSSGK